MPAQATNIEIPLVDYTALRSVLAANHEAARPTLYVVSIPEAPDILPAATVDVAERNRQASLDFLHQLVMGSDEVR
jgi:hypothetical protein